MSSFASAKGPSITARFAPTYLTRQPLELGWSPEASSSTPAFCSSSWYFAMSAMSFSEGIAPASESFVALTIIMNRIVISPCGREPGLRTVSAGWKTSLQSTTNGPLRNRHGGRSRPLRSRSGGRQIAIRPAKGRKSKRDADGADSYRERTDVKPGVGAEAVEDPAAHRGTERHSEAGHHGRGAEHRAEDALPEVFARKDRVERHHAAVGEAERGGDGVELAQPRGENERARRDRLDDEPGDEHALHAEAVGEHAEREAATEPGEALDAVDRDRGERREAAGHGVGDRVEDRPGVRRAAGEEGEREHGERQRDERVAQAHWRSFGAALRRSLRRRRPAHEERRRDECRPDEHGEHDLRAAPVQLRDEPSGK